jgi:hypothetical protein
MDQTAQESSGLWGETMRMALGRLKNGGGVERVAVQWTFLASHGAKKRLCGVSWRHELTFVDFWRIHMSP